MEVKLLSGKNVTTYKRLLGYVVRYWQLFVLAMLGNVAYSGIDALMTKLLQPLIDKGFVLRDPNTIRYIPIVLPLIFLVRSLTSFISTYCMTWIARQIVMIMRQEVFAHMQKLPASFYDNVTSGQLLSKLIFNVDQVTKACTSAITLLIRQGFMVIFLLTVMFITSWYYTLLFLTVTPVVTLLFVYASRRFRVLGRKIQDAIGAVTHIAEENIEGYKVVRLFGGIQHEIKQFADATERYRALEMKNALVEALSVPLIQLLGGCALALIVYTATQAGPGSLTAGAFTALTVAMIGLLRPIKQLSAVNSDIQRGIAGAESVFELLDQSVEPDYGTEIVKRLSGSICFKDVSFAYRKEKGLVLKSVNFNIKPGETVALVGRSGSGKSTLASLISRFYDHYEGDILLDDVDIRKYQLDNLREQLAIVSQHVTLFNDSIGNNIAYGRWQEKSADKLSSMSAAAHALEFINALPQGMDTLVGENGVLLSGGQRQRIAIARALFKNAPILILDEATSSLDTESEAIIQDALIELMRTRTTLVIAHRLSTIENADRIIVLEDGKIIESGKHSELLALNGAYARLHQSQFKE